MFAKQMLRVVAVVALGMVFWAGPAQATTITDTSGTGTPPAVSATDLANSDQATFGSLNVNNDPANPDPTGRWSYPTDWNGGSYTWLNDGANAGGGYNPGWASSHHDPPNTDPAIQTFTFDTTVNTYGYDITSIVTTSLDRDGRSWQKYNLEYHTVGGGWTAVIGDVAGYTVQRGTANSNAGEYSWRQVTLSEMGLTQVDQLRFTSPRYTSGTKGCTSWAEMDVFGVASIPEPATMALLAFGGIGVLLKRRRRA